MCNSALENWISEKEKCYYFVFKDGLSIVLAPYRYGCVIWNWMRVVGLWSLRAIRFFSFLILCFFVWMSLDLLVYTVSSLLLIRSSWPWLEEIRLFPLQTWDGKDMLPILYYSSEGKWFCPFQRATSSI